MMFEACNDDYRAITYRRLPNSMNARTRPSRPIDNFNKEARTRALINALIDALNFVRPPEIPS